MKTENIFIIHPDTPEQENALKAFAKALKIKFKVTKGEHYNPDFAAKIERGRQDYKEGKGTIMNLDELNSLWK
ncbi:MAG: hypothetical protein PHI28_17555 [Mangrovibacterium sp.]|nr:hypothetical protein [Mangrovibacterium sp.]